MEQPPPGSFRYFAFVGRFSADPAEKRSLSHPPPSALCPLPSALCPLPSARSNPNTAIGTSIINCACHARYSTYAAREKLAIT